MSLSVLLSVGAGVLGIDFHDLAWNIPGVSGGRLVVRDSDAYSSSQISHLALPAPVRHQARPGPAPPGLQVEAQCLPPHWPRLHLGLCQAILSVMSSLDIYNN